MQIKETSRGREGISGEPVTVESVTAEINGLPMGEAFTTTFLYYTKETSREAQEMGGGVVRLIGVVDGEWPQYSMEIKFLKEPCSRVLSLKLARGSTVGTVGVTFFQVESSWRPDRPSFHMYGDDVRDSWVDKGFEIMRELGRLLVPAAEVPS